MAKLILTASISLLGLVATQIRAEDPATRLNGTWQYLAAIESDRITSYDNSSPMQLVIRGNTWALFKDGMLMKGTVENVEYDKQTSPISFVRRKGKAPHAVGYAILKVENNHLMYTATPLDASRFGSTSGAIGDYEPDPESARRPLQPVGDKNLYERPPEHFSPEGTRNTQYILRRINDSTSALSQITTR